ncbi:hypothetical protein B0F90DRAFT_1909242 [Multifurca ochricompacta]|uniref:Uncharacterized protein n=1 Tax=Multifurca ochricompacta TaxID=376703 RepID=A0AAD4MCY8_9AGAM|nr:hypothetical protein B0F90DRAFT_1909242 [Multifurca ochricompacta]
MSTTDVHPHPQNSISLQTSTDNLVSAIQNVTLSPVAVTDTSPSDNSLSPIRPLVSYTQTQILFLHKSPLVALPKGMPPLKDWFGDWNEQNATKKDSDASATTSGARDKRFRRDQEDTTDLPPRATFRSTLSQPSQMGNFKHQSIRTSEREKDKDADRDRERDLRDKEGQERLRSLSDKYDRDRLSSPAGGTSLRNRERDSAPHLVGGTSRLTSQTSLSSGATRRTDGRDSSRRKAGESSEDWRRANGCSSRSVGSDDRERPRSRVRDSSKQRRESSPTRRDRDLDRDRDRDRDEHRRRDDRRDDHTRRDRDVDDDPRRWRDDGKRDERMAARRELRDKEYREREREREREKERSSRASERDSNWDSDRPRDRERDRWAVDERDSRSKRTNGRDRRGHSRDEDREGKERDERKDPRVRAEEKEPAWMDTYIPSESGVGILGGKAENGELDSIQTWKMGMKEKERKERESEVSRTGGDSERVGSTKTRETQATQPTEPPLDEIQLFKLMIKREEEKNKAALKGPSNDPAVAYLGPETETAPLSQKLSTSTSEGQATSGFASSPLVEALAPATAPSTKPSTPSIESPKPPGSRFFPNPSTSDSSALQGPQDRQPTTSVIKPPTPSQFNPPSGSRLLAFGSRTPSATTAPILSSETPPFTISATTLDIPSSLQPITNGPRSGLDVDVVNVDSTARSLPPPGFSNLVNPHRQPAISSDGNAHAHQENLRRQSLSSFGDRTAYGTPSDLNSYSEIGPTNPLGIQSTIPKSQSPSFDSGGRERGSGGSPYPQQKGSRFAKFFDGKSRELPTTASENMDSHPLLPYQRQLSIGGESYTFNAENRAMEDIFTMLQNSTQGQRLAQASHHIQPSGYSQTPFVHQHANVSTARQAQLAPIGRNYDILYDNRLDDRNFVPDGMVPGLRPPRRESGMFQDPLDELSAFNVQQRIPPQRVVDQIYPTPLPSMYPNQTGVPRNAGLSVQQPFRNGTSPNATQLHASPQQRLPPGLANLGGRPPHDPTQFLGSTVGVPSPHLQGNGSGQTAYNFSSGGIGYPSSTQVRGPPGVSPNVQGTLDPGHVGSLLHATKLDVRAPSQAQLLGLNNGAGAAGLRAPGVGFPQQNVLTMHAPHTAMRQQSHIHQQPHPQSMSHLLPQHIQASPSGGSQPAQDLMALLMHGAPRD